MRSRENDIDYIVKQVKKEIADMEASKRRIAQIAKRSFGKWANDALAKIGRAYGYIISIAPRRFYKIWSYLFNK